ncbi:MAG: N-6 DNA methylase [Planctomycetes bacterium]|nr:N-6 DNA methylase [Planctomycetota bacterium]
MSAGNRSIFTTVRTEGAILPPDLLQRVVEGDRSLGGFTPADYHLTEGEKLNEAINRSWTRLRGAWLGFRGAEAKLPAADPGTSLTRERWLLALFQEFGYGRLVAAKAIDLGDKSYPISHLWQNTPIHLVGCRVDLDRRSAGVAGAARGSPHSVVQELLNRSDAHLWAFVSNGLRLRILRDNVSLTRQAFVEFDLAAMMEGEVYSDFSLLWLVCHQSRVEAERPEACRLEAWSRAAQEQGTRALDQLRQGVEAAIVALGRGFQAHPANPVLRDKLRTGALSGQDYYRQLLRIVYRMLFLFVAEDRELLLDPRAEAAARERYTRYYALARLRRLAEARRGSKHADLWRGVVLVMGKLGKDEGCPALALPALGSFLWSEAAIGVLGGCELANHDLLAAIRALAFVQDGKVRRGVDYKNLGAEELGSVYESLLELHPVIDAGAGKFELASAGGSERKTTGSYYTPTSLITCLLDSALDPVLDEAVKQPTAAAAATAILKLKVCDPACGSGHFLIAAAHRIAKRLAAVRTGEEEPAPEAMRTALRDVIGHCLYGVDLNEMAVELCKVSLWMEALEPGKPLSFLDHRIRCGNSLLGATPALVAAGIPDAAFEPIEGDDKKIASALRHENRDARRGQGNLFSALEPKSFASARALADTVAALDALPEATISDVHHKEDDFQRMEHTAGVVALHRAADAWCAAFVGAKAPDTPPAITHATFARLVKEPAEAPSAVLAEVARLHEAYGFFHWHLAFPEVFRVSEAGAAESPDDARQGWRGGFDVVLGNPPWDTLSPDAKEFFSNYDPDVRFRDSAGQRRIIDRLLEQCEIAERWRLHCRRLYSQVHFFKDSGRFRLFAPGNLGKGDFNVYRMFVETALQIARSGGRVSQIVPEGLYNGANCMAIRKELFESCRLDRLLGFENANETWFPGVDTRAKFCIYSAAKSGTTTSFRTAFNIRSEAALAAAAAAGGGLDLPVAMIPEFSPDALAIMEFSDQRDIDIASKMYSRWPKFGDETAGPPRRLYMREIDMGNDRDLFDEAPGGLPLYEGRMVDQFDHRAKGYRSGRGRAAVWEELPFGSAGKSIQPQWRIPVARVPEKTRERVQQFRVGFCDVGSPTNERTLVAALISQEALCGHSVPTITFGAAEDWAYCLWLAVANSYAMDFLVRQKVSLHMTYIVLDSLPFPRLPASDPRVARIVRLALQLSCTGPEMAPFWNAMAQAGWVEHVPVAGPSPGIVEEAARLEARAELDAIVARDLFGLSRAQLAYILGTFPIVERRDRERYGSFRSRDLILEFFDQAAPAAAPPELDAVQVPPPAISRAAAAPPVPVVALGRVATPEPFLRVRPRPGDRYRTCVPLLSLRAAAGAFSDDQAVEFDSWVEIATTHPLRKGMFIAQVVGRSMEPLIPDGAHCLFVRHPGGTREGQIVLVQHRSIQDLEAGGTYTIKEYHSEKQRTPDGSWHHSLVRLQPLNPSYTPIVIRCDSEDSGNDLKVIARFLEVLHFSP